MIKSMYNITEKLFFYKESEEKTSIYIHSFFTVYDIV